MAPVTIERTRDQRLAALQHANRIRFYRANVKRQLRAGTGQATFFLASPPDEMLTMKVRDLLLALPKYGDLKVRRLMFAVRVSDTKTVGGLSDRQRNELIGMLR